MYSYEGSNNMGGRRSPPNQDGFYSLSGYLSSRARASADHESDLPQVERRAITVDAQTVPKLPWKSAPCFETA